DDIIEPFPRSPALPHGSDVQGQEAAFHRRVQEEGPAGGRCLCGVRSDRRVAPAGGVVLLAPVTWRHARERGELEGLAPKKRGPTGREANPLAKELVAKEREIARLKAENAKLQIICDVQKKVSLLLGVTLPTIREDDESSKGSS